MTSRRTAAAVLFAATLAAMPALPVARAGTDAAAYQNNRANRGPRRALDRPMPEVHFNAVSLVDVIDFLTDASGANFSVDWKALEGAHVARDAQITLKMNASVPLRKVLGMVLKQAAADAPLTFYVDDGVIQVTTQEAEDKELISRVYPIQDLLFQAPDYGGAPQLDLQSATQGQSGGGGGGGGSQSQSLFQGNQTSTADAGDTQKSRADDIIKMITDTVRPELWQINGGTATISFYRGMLIVNAPRSIHELLESH